MKYRATKNDEETLSTQECTNLGFMYCAEYGVDLSVFSDKQWVGIVSQDLIGVSRLTYAFASMVENGRYASSINDLVALCAEAPVPGSLLVSDLYTALTAGTRDDLERIALVDDRDAALVARWRLEYDIGVDHLMPKKFLSRSLEITVGKDAISKLIALYETEACEPLDRLSDTKIFSDMVYHRCTSPLFWGLMQARNVESMSLEDLLLWSVVPDQVPKYVGNTDKGYQWLLDCLTAEKADEFSEYLLVNWEDYQAGLVDTTNPLMSAHILVSGKHPIHPDSYIVARWRLENGLFL